MSEVPAGYVRLEKSERHKAANASLVGPANAHDVISVSVRVRRRPDAPPLPDMNHWESTSVRDRKYLSREEFTGQYGADPGDLTRVADFAKSAGLTVTESSAARRTVV